MGHLSSKHPFSQPALSYRSSFVNLFEEEAAVAPPELNLNGLGRRHTLSSTRVLTTTCGEQRKSRESRTTWLSTRSYCWCDNVQRHKTNVQRGAGVTGGQKHLADDALVLLHHLSLPLPLVHGLPRSSDLSPAHPMPSA
eukprot:557386-Rhodomonas_salina.1